MKNNFTLICTLSFLPIYLTNSPTVDFGECAFGGDVMLSRHEIENNRAIGPGQWNFPEGWCNRALIRWPVASKKMYHSGLICILSTQRNILFLSHAFLFFLILSVFFCEPMIIYRFFRDRF